MDRKPLQNPEILRLTARSAAARSALGSEVVKLRRRLDVTSRLRDSLKSKPASWLLGSTVTGLAFSLLFPRFRRSAPPPSAAHGKSTAMRIISMAWSAAQPFVKTWATKQIQAWLAQRALPTSYETSPRNQTR